jgi:hypothetical protein
VAGRYDGRREPAHQASTEQAEPWVRTGSVPTVLGVGGADGPEAERRRRLIASLLVLALVLGAGAVVLSTLLG